MRCNVLLFLWLAQLPCNGLGYLVCYAYFGPVSDLGFTYVQNLARAWADEELGTTSKYVENVFWLPESGQKEVMDGFISDNCDLIVTGSDTLQSLAKEYADKSVVE